MIAQDVTTRTRILTAATTLFSRYGYKRTTMEDIATEAGLSRAGLYLQFRNKEDIFRELARGLQEESLTAAGAALAKHGTLAERIRLAIEAKSLKMMEIAHGSPHGGELMDENHRLCGDVATEAEARFLTMLAETLSAAEASGEIALAAAGLTAGEAAEVLLHSVSGLKRPGVDPGVYRRRLASLVRIFVAGLAA